MIFTREGGELGVFPGTTAPPMVDRTKNTAMAKLNKDEAMALICQLSKAFGIESVPATATYEKVYIVLDSPTFFYPKDGS